MGKIKLLHLISRIDIGGAEKQLLNLAAGLDKEKYSICVGYFEGSGELKDEFEGRGIKTRNFKFRWFWGALLLPSLYQDMKTNRYDIVHTHGFKADLWGAVSAKLSGVPKIISTVHNQEQYFKNPFIRSLERWIISPINDTIIAVSDGVRQFLLRTGAAPETKLKKIYYGLNAVEIRADKGSNIRREFGLDEAAPLIGCAGRLTEQKGQRYFIQAAKTVIEKIPQAKFLVIGRGKLEKELKGLSGSLGLDSSIIFTGFRKDIYSMVNALDLLVMPSLWEGFGMLLLEAFALGKPVIAARVGGIPEIIEDGKTGILVEPADACKLSQAIIKLLQDPGLVKIMRENAGTKLKEKFSIEGMVRQMDEVYAGGEQDV